MRGISSSSLRRAGVRLQGGFAPASTLPDIAVLFSPLRSLRVRRLLEASGDPSIRSKTEPTPRTAGSKGEPCGPWKRTSGSVHRSAILLKVARNPPARVSQSSGAATPRANGETFNKARAGTSRSRTNDIRCLAFYFHVLSFFFVSSVSIRRVTLAPTRRSSQWAETSGFEACASVVV